MKAVTRGTGVVPYVLKDDRGLPKEEQSTFHLRLLDQGERMDAYDNMNTTTVLESGQVQQKGRAWAQALDLCRTRIMRIDNFPVGDTKPWPDGEKERLAYLEQLDPVHIQELGTAIRDASHLSDAAGN